jgi:hypothetical protein
MNITKRLQQGRQLDREQHKQKEVLKVGTLRAGNTGMMSGTGDFAGACPRTVHLRQLGYELEVPDDSKMIMFQMGIANESVVFKDLMHTSGPEEVILQEEEIPISWLTSNGTKVTGRPDMVLCSKKDGQTIPFLGIEIKSIASVWTSREVLFEGQPKLPHLLQSAHYSWKLGVPFRLVYKQYSNQAVPGWAGKLFPKQGEPHSQHISYNEKGDIKYIEPFEIAYELEWDSSSRKYLRYRREIGEGEKELDWTRTLISQQDVERFYEFVANMQETKVLGVRPMTIDAQGNEKNYSNCGYCPLKDTCDKHESKGYDKWMAAVLKEMNSGKIMTEGNVK